MTERISLEYSLGKFGMALRAMELMCVGDEQAFTTLNVMRNHLRVVIHYI